MLITRSREDRVPLDKIFENQNPILDPPTLAKTKLEQIWSNNRLKSIAEIHNNTTLLLTPLTHFMLGNAIAQFYANCKVPVTNSN